MDLIELALLRVDFVDRLDQTECDLGRGSQSSMDGESWMLVPVPGSDPTVIVRTLSTGISTLSPSWSLVKRPYFGPLGIARAWMQPMIHI